MPFGVFYYPVPAFMGSLPRVNSRNGILNFTITDLHLLVAQCQNTVWHSVMLEYRSF